MLRRRDRQRPAGPAEVGQVLRRVVDARRQRASTTAATTSRKPGEQFTGPNYFQKLYYHKLGTPQADDKLIYERPDEKEWGFDGDVTDDGHYLVITVWRGTERKNQVFYQDLQRARRARSSNCSPASTPSTTSSATTGRCSCFTTDLDAPLRRVIAIDIAQAGARELARR